MIKSKISIFLILIISLFSLFFLYKNYISYVGQMFTVNDYNSGQYNFSYKEIDSLSPGIPNISVTTLPINYLKARYLNHEKRYDEAIDLLTKKERDNPYLFAKEHELANSYIAKDDFYIAYKYAKIAFNNFPNSSLHQAQILFLSSKLYGIDSVLKIKNLDFIKKELFFENYIFYLGSISFAGDSVLIAETNYALEKFPDNKKLIDLRQRAYFGIERVNKSNELFNQAIINQENFNEIELIQILEGSVKINPLNTEAIENLGILYFKNDNIERAEDYFKKFDSIKYKALDLGKVEFYLASIYLEKNIDSLACLNYLKSFKKGFEPSKEFLDLYCNY